MKYILLSLLFILQGCANNFMDVIIKDNDKIHNLSIKEKNGLYITSKNYTFSNHSNIEIQFHTVTPSMIKEFEEQYNLTLKEVLIIGDYVYSHTHNSILTLIEYISQDNNVKKVTPMFDSTLQKY